MNAACMLGVMGCVLQNVVLLRGFPLPGFIFVSTTPIFVSLGFQVFFEMTVCLLTFSRKQPSSETLRGSILWNVSACVPEAFALSTSRSFSVSVSVSPVFFFFFGCVLAEFYDSKTYSTAKCLFDSRERRFLLTLHRALCKRGGGFNAFSPPFFFVLSSRWLASYAGQWEVPASTAIFLSFFFGSVLSCVVHFILGSLDSHPYPFCRCLCTQVRHIRLPSFFFVSLFTFLSRNRCDQLPHLVNALNMTHQHLFP